MVTALDPPGRMAKKKPNPTVQVRIPLDVAEAAAIVAAYRRTQTSDLLGEILRPILREMHAAEARKAGVAGPSEAPKKGGGR